MQTLRICDDNGDGGGAGGGGGVRKRSGGDGGEQEEDIAGCRSPLSDVKNTAGVSLGGGMNGSGKSRLIKTNTSDARSREAHAQEKEEGGGDGASTPTAAVGHGDDALGGTSSSSDDDGVRGIDLSADSDVMTEKQDVTKSAFVRRKVARAMDSAMTNFEARCAELQAELDAARAKAAESNSENHALMEMNTMLTWRLAEMEATLSEQQKTMTPTSVVREESKSVVGGVDGAGVDYDTAEEGDAESNGSVSLSPKLEMRDFFFSRSDDGDIDNTSLALSRLARDADTDEQTGGRVIDGENDRGVLDDPRLESLAELTSRTWIAEARAELLAERLEEHVRSQEAEVDADNAVVRMKQSEIDALKLENKELLSELERTAVTEHVTEASRVELEAKAKLVDELEQELTQARAANYELACKHRAGLSRLQEVIEGDGKLRQQLAAQAALISSLESQRHEIASAMDTQRTWHQEHGDTVEDLGTISKQAVKEQLDDMMRENAELREAVARQQDSIRVLSSRGEDMIQLLHVIEEEEETRSQAQEAVACAPTRSSMEDMRLLEFQLGEERNDFRLLRASYEAKWEAAEAEQKRHVERISHLERENRALRSEIEESAAEVAAVKSRYSALQQDQILVDEAVHRLVACVHSSRTGVGYHTFQQWTTLSMSRRLSEIASAKGGVTTLADSLDAVNGTVARQRKAMALQDEKRAALSTSLDETLAKAKAMQHDIDDRMRAERVVREQLTRATDALASLEKDKKNLRGGLAKVTSERDAERTCTKRLKEELLNFKKLRDNLADELSDALDRERSALKKAEEYLSSAKEGERAMRCIASLKQDVVQRNRDLETANASLEEARHALAKESEALSLQSDHATHLSEVNARQVTEIGSLKSEVRRLRDDAAAWERRIEEVSALERGLRIDKENIERDLAATRGEMREMERARTNGNDALSLSTDRINALNGRIQAMKEELRRAQESKDDADTRAASLQTRCESLEASMSALRASHDSALGVSAGDCVAIASTSGNARSGNGDGNNLDVHGRKRLDDRIVSQARQIEALQDKLKRALDARHEAESKAAVLQVRCESADALEAALHALQQPMAGDDDDEARGAADESAVAAREKLVALLSSNTSLVKEISERLTSSLLEKPASVQHLESVATELAENERPQQQGDMAIWCGSGAVDEEDTSSERSMGSSRSREYNMHKLFAKAKKYRDRSKELEGRLHEQEAQHKDAIRRLEAQMHALKNNGGNDDDDDVGASARNGIVYVRR